jgi:hypothetical protein
VPRLEDLDLLLEYPVNTIMEDHTPQVTQKLSSLVDS